MRGLLLGDELLPLLEPDAALAPAALLEPDVLGDDMLGDELLPLEALPFGQSAPVQFDELPLALPVAEALPLPEAEVLELGVDDEDGDVADVLPVPVLLPLPALLPLLEHAALSNAAAIAALMAFRTICIPPE